MRSMLGPVLLLLPLGFLIAAPVTTLLVVGSCGAFFLSHRRIWVTIQPLEKGIGVKLGGNAHRNQPAFALFFDELKKDLDDALSS